MLHLELELPNHVCYDPGDVVGIYCPNHSHLVAQLLKVSRCALSAVCRMAS